ncbi:MAG: NAD(+)/NADH kinase [Lachnospiraceae bacterium]|nr:NAD(+)/NADH kinase [Lachnospiraceae bacterium]
MAKQKKTMYYIMPNRTKDVRGTFTKKVERFLKDHGKECMVLTEEREDGQRVIPPLPKGYEGVALVLGGDGTVLRAVRDMRKDQMPVLGFNLGTIGYLAEIEKAGWEEALLKVISGEYSTEKRMMIYGEVRTPDGRKKTKVHEYGCMALNDIVLVRQGSLQILSFTVYVGGRKLNSIHADGLVIATPTGSTAYNLSAGGPIIEPTAKMILLTPICAQELGARSIVLSAEQEIMVELVMEKNRTKSDASVKVVFDGVEELVMEPGDRILVRPSERKTTLIKLGDSSFLDVLHRKLEN